MNYLKQIKQEVKSLNKEFGISQAQIARFIDISENTFNAWLTERVTCRHSKIVLLALMELRRRLNLQDDLIKISKRSRKNA